MMLMLVACSCCQPTSSQRHDLDVIKQSYVTASDAEDSYCAVHQRCDSVRTAHYNASAALMTAESEMTDDSISEARKRVAEFLAAERQP
jgi:hypothetical protein